MIKVLYLVEDLKIGGIEKLLEYLCLYLDKTKFVVSVWCLSRGGEIAEKLIGQGVEVKIFNFRRYLNPLPIYSLTKNLTQYAPDIIHTHGYPAGVLGRIGGWLAGVPVIIHHLHSTCWEFSRCQFLWERFLGLFSSRIIVCSLAVKDFALAMGIPEKKITLVYNGVPVPEEKEHILALGWRQKLGIQTDELIIGCVASLVPNKGQHCLIDVFSELKKKLLKIKLLLVGEGKERSLLEAKVRQLDIEADVIFTGKQDNIGPLVRLMDIIVLPSLEREGLGMCLLEAMARGKVIIGSKLGGIPEVIGEGINGFLVKPGDVEGLARVLLDLAEDPEKRWQMGKMGNKIYQEKFSFSKMQKELESIYSR